METLKIVGINDDVTTCEKCGKKNLKRTVVLSDGMHEVHYGSDCAAQALMGKKSKKNAAIVSSQALAVQKATEWLKKYTPYEVSYFIGTKFGYGAGMAQGKFWIGDFAKLEV